MRGIRGAITVEKNSAEEIYSAARELVTEILNRNKIATGDLFSIEKI